MQLVSEQLTDEVLKTYLYGVLCKRCRKPLACGYVQLKPDAQTDDLRSAGRLLSQTGQYVTCVAFDSNGEVCGESTFVALSAVIFIH